MLSPTLQTCDSTESMVLTAFTAPRNCYGVSYLAILLSRVANRDTPLMKDQERDVLRKTILELVKKSHVHYTDIEKKAVENAISQMPLRTNQPATVRIQQDWPLGLHSSSWKPRRHAMGAQPSPMGINQATTPHIQSDKVVAFTEEKT